MHSRLACSIQNGQDLDLNSSSHTNNAYKHERNLLVLLGSNIMYRWAPSNIFLVFGENRLKNLLNFDKFQI